MIDPQQLAALQAKTKSIKAEITLDHPKRSLSLMLSPSTPEDEVAIQQVLSQLSQQMAIQLDSFLGIKGKMREISG